MNRNRLLSLIAFLIAYGVINFFVQHHDNDVLKSLLLISFWCIVLLFLKLNNKLKKYGISLYKTINKPTLLFVLPVLVCIIFNVTVLFNNGFKIRNYLCFTAYDIVVIISCVFGEELFFRGIILNLLRERMDKPITCIFISSVLFSLAHTVNILNGASINSILTQLFLSFSVGLCLTAVAYYSKSIAISFALHLLFNITAVDNIMIDNGTYIIISTLVFIAFSIIMFGKFGVNKKSNDFDNI